MNLLTSIQNALMFVNDHWTQIIICIGLIITIYKKAKAYWAKSTEEKVAIAMKQIKTRVVELCTQAELDYDEWVKAGEIKRAQVIGEIFDMYPILNRLTDQETLIAAIDDLIDEALVTMREVFSENKNNQSITTKE